MTTKSTASNTRVGDTPKQHSHKCYIFQRGFGSVVRVRSIITQLLLKCAEAVNGGRQNIKDGFEFKAVWGKSIDAFR